MAFVSACWALYWERKGEVGGKVRGKRGREGGGKGLGREKREEGKAGRREEGAGTDLNCCVSHRPEIASAKLPKPRPTPQSARLSSSRCTTRGAHFGVEQNRWEGREGYATRGIQHLADGARDVGGVALDDEFEAVVGDDGDVFGEFFVVCHCVCVCGV